MHILLTNDDGIDAAGLACFYRALLPFGRVSVVAPMNQQSGTGHSIHFGPDIPIAQKSDPLYGDCWTVDGTPADCVRVALGCLLHTPVDWVFSGVNLGANLGVDIYYSGTVAAAREAALLGVQSAAFSLYIDPAHPEWLDWGRLQGQVERLIGLIQGQDSLREGFWNVNFPCQPAQSSFPRILRAPLCRQAVPLHYSGDGRSIVKHSGLYPDRLEETQTDLPLVLGGAIVVTAVGLFPDDTIQDVQSLGE